jgi:hypothetical protein
MTDELVKIPPLNLPLRKGETSGQPLEIATFMNEKLKQSEINATAWAACDTFRGWWTRRSTRTTFW